MNKSKNNYGKSAKSLMGESSYWAIILMNNTKKKQEFVEETQIWRHNIAAILYCLINC